MAVVINNQSKCWLCPEIALPKAKWSSLMDGVVAESLSKLMWLDPVEFAEFFKVANYCVACQEIVLNVDFLMRSFYDIQSKIDKLRTKISQSIKHNEDLWTTIYQSSPQFDPAFQAEYPEESIQNDEIPVDEQVAPGDQNDIDSASENMSLSPNPKRSYFRGSPRRQYEMKFQRASTPRSIKSPVKSSTPKTPGFSDENENAECVKVPNVRTKRKRTSKPKKLHKTVKIIVPFRRPTRNTPSKLPVPSEEGQNESEEESVGQESDEDFVALKNSSCSESEKIEEVDIVSDSEDVTTAPNDTIMEDSLADVSDSVANIPVTTETENPADTSHDDGHSTDKMYDSNTATMTDDSPHTVAATSTTESHPNMNAEAQTSLRKLKSRNDSSSGLVQPNVKGHLFGKKCRMVCNDEEDVEIALTKIYMCPNDNCYQRYDTPEELQIHITTKHQKKLHSKPDSGIKQLTCQEPGCSFVCELPRVLQVHFFRAHKNDLRPFKCKICIQAFARYDVLVSHLKSDEHRQTVLEKRNGDQVQPTSNISDQAQATTKSQVPVASVTDTCKAVDISETETMEVIVPDIIEHEEEIAAVSNAPKPLIPKISNRKPRTRVPKLTEPEYLICDFCGTTHKTKARLREHFMKKHHGEFRLRCDFCTKKFFFDDDFAIHEKAHFHRKMAYPDLDRFDCVMHACTQYFENQDLLKEHVMVVHDHLRKQKRPKKRKKAVDNSDSETLKNSDTKSEVPAPEDGPPPSKKKKPLECECGVCGLVFKNNSLLNDHILVHTDIFEFKCTECTMGFKWKRSLKSHLEAVHGHNDGQIFNCLHCSDTFPRRYQLHRHTVWHNKGGDEKTKPYRKINPMKALATTRLAKTRLIEAQKQKLKNKKTGSVKQ